MNKNDRYIVALSGRRVSLSPDTDTPSLKDIAVSHCRTPMYSGQTRYFYSVAHHCVAACEIAEECGEPPLISILTLLHEVETSVFGDIPGPVKCDAQRLLEYSLRRKTLIDINIFHCLNEATDLIGKYWPKVEYYAKLEQAASTVALLGLAEDRKSVV